MQHPIYCVEVELVDGKPKIMYNVAENVKIVVEDNGDTSIYVEQTKFNYNTYSEIIDSLNTNTMTNLYGDNYRRMFCTEDRIKEVALLMIKDLHEKLYIKRENMLEKIHEITILLKALEV